MWYRPYLLSYICVNSLVHMPHTTKLHRLNGKWFSFEEIKYVQKKEKYFTMKYTRNQRIIVGKNDWHQFVIIDGRHLLEAYRRMRKIIPKHLIWFTNKNVEKLFTSKYKWLQKYHEIYSYFRRSIYTGII